MSHGGGGGGAGGGGGYAGSGGGLVPMVDATAVALDHVTVTDGSRGTGNGVDHFKHVSGRICVRCDREINARQAARRKGENGWVHDTCPPEGL
jgi:hypothetical protein